MKPSLKFFLVIIGSILFNLVFWQEKLALNAVLFDLFVLASLLTLYPGGFKSQPVRWLLAAHLVTSIAVLFHNTVLSKIAFCSTLLLLAVFTQYKHRSAWYATASMFMNYVFSPASLAVHIASLRTGNYDVSSKAKKLRILLIPILLLGVFLLMYGTANKVFLSIANELGLLLNGYFSKLISWVSWERMGFFMIGLLVTTGLLWKSAVNYFSELDSTRNNDLVRTKHALTVWEKSSWFDLLSIIMGRFATGMLALRNEHTTGLISLALLNLLLLFINGIDIVYVWFGFEDRSRLNLSEYVHEGTGMLIFSIIAAIIVLLFFFRGNLNFYTKNKWLRIGAYAWLIQNAVLVVSVVLRDYHYIDRLGLAYKRIGVLFFLCLVLCGLLTVFIKIQQRKTAYFLLRTNAWCVIVMLVVGSCVHWDEEIARYNLARKETVRVDVRFLLTLSDKTLPLLQKNKDIFGNAPVVTGKEKDDRNLAPLEQFEMRKAAFFKQQGQLTWLSWNRADALTKARLNFPNQTGRLKTNGKETAGGPAPSPGEAGDLFSLRNCVVLPVWPHGFMEGY